MSLAYPDHVLADSHQLVVQLRIAHFHLLQLEDPLVTALSQLALVLLQTLDDLQRQFKTSDCCVFAKRRKVRSRFSTENHITQ